MHGEKENFTIDVFLLIRLNEKFTLFFSYAHLCSTRSSSRKALFYTIFRKFRKHVCTWNDKTVWNSVGHNEKRVWSIDEHKKKRLWIFHWGETLLLAAIDSVKIALSWIHTKECHTLHSFDLRLSFENCSTNRFYVNLWKCF